ncbi:MAG: nucleoside kinase [Treponema sp.]|nr:nucleoside kinase [Candidatus Treponema equi]
MNKIKITFPDNSIIESETEIRPLIFIDHFKSDKKLVAVKVNNEVCSLATPINISAKVEPVYADTKEGSSIYRRSLCFILAASAHKLFPGKRLLVGPSIAYGYYYTLEKDSTITQEELDALKLEMKRLIDEDNAIETAYVSYEDACSLFESLNLTETRKSLNYHCPSKILLNKVGDFTDLYFGPLVPNTGLIDVFDIVKYNDGFLLRFPKHTDPTKLSEFEDQPKLFNIFKNYKNWGKKLGVTSAAGLNQLIHDKKVNDFISISETYQTKMISDIADQIQDKKTARVVLIAGPSSSGKTTTSKKLSMQLQARGFTPKVISLDSYYVGRAETPKDENGNYDYECLEALNVKMLNENLVDMFNGKEIKLPSYDFHEGVSYFKGDTMHLEENDILVMEGIHGLNDKLTPLVAPELKFKIYLSALTQLNLDDHNRISTSDNRLIRRIVRDYNYRGKSAADTIGMWDSVQKGERLHIFPFQNNADAMLNTALDYELAVLRVYAAPLLRCVTPMQKEYAEACRLLKFLDNFQTIPANAVPQDSIIREFIGGSKFKY